MKTKSPLFHTLIATITLVLGACSTAPYTEEYQSQSPDFDIYDFFDGKVTAWAIVQNRKGEVVQRFRADIDGSIDGGVLTLDERFTYFLGEGLERRIWRIRSNQQGQLIGEADDIIGSANGQLYGNALNWQYQMDLTVSSGTYRVRFDDWMWMLDTETLMNRAYIRKFGLVLAEVTLFMQKQP